MPGLVEQGIDFGRRGALRHGILVSAHHSHMILTEAGYVVDLANIGIDGLHQALTEDYDLAILDVMLPGQDGWQILQAMRN